MVAFTTYDRQVHHGFVNLVDFARLLPGTNFVGGAFENLSASAKSCQAVKLSSCLRFGKKLSSRQAVKLSKFV